MHEITDAAGRQWRLSVNAATVERVLEETEVDLYEYGMHGEHEDLRTTLIFRFRADPILLCKVLFSLLRPQATAQQVDWEAFAEAFSDRSLWDARDALEEEIANFTVHPDRAETLRAAVNKVTELMNETHRFVMARTMDAIRNPEIDALHRSELQRLGARFGKTPASPASETRANSPTAS